MFISYSGKYTDDKIPYNNTEELINLFHKYIKFN